MRPVLTFEIYSKATKTRKHLVSFNIWLRRKKMHKQSWGVTHLESSCLEKYCLIYPREKKTKEYNRENTEGPHPIFVVF